MKQWVEDAWLKKVVILDVDVTEDYVREWKEKTESPTEINKL